MYVDVLTHICPWMFALDHVHYARWLPVFIKTLRELDVRHPEIYNEFMNGKFVTQKSNKPFSSLSDDHIQCNRNVKDHGGTVGIMTNPTSLVRWMVAGPEISRMVKEYEDLVGIVADGDTQYSHHEDTKAFEKRFQNDVRSLVQVIEDEGNPFQEDDVLVSLVSKEVMDGPAIESIKQAASIVDTYYPHTKRVGTASSKLIKTKRNYSNY